MLVTLAILGVGAYLLTRKGKGVRGVGDVLRSSYDDMFVTTTDGNHAVYFMVDKSTGEIVASGYDLVEIWDDEDVTKEGKDEPDLVWQPTFFIGRFQDWESARREAVLSMYDHTFSDLNARRNLYMFNPEDLGMSIFDDLFM